MNRLRVSSTIIAVSRIGIYSERSGQRARRLMIIPGIQEDCRHLQQAIGFKPRDAVVRQLPGQPANDSVAETENPDEMEIPAGGDRGGLNGAAAIDGRLKRPFCRRPERDSGKRERQDEHKGDDQSGHGRAPFADVVCRKIAPAARK